MRGGTRRAPTLPFVRTAVEGSPSSQRIPSVPGAMAASTVPDGQASRKSHKIKKSHKNFVAIRKKPGRVLLAATAVYFLSWIFKLGENEFAGYCRSGVRSEEEAGWPPML